MRRLLAKIYGQFVGSRNRRYDAGAKETNRLGARTISVGNITAGGTGKTPIVAVIARMLADNGERVCIISRGYGRRDENKHIVVSNGLEILADVDESGDEPFELALALLGKAMVIANADRVEAAAWVLENNPKPPTVFILDDAFQHRRVIRDLDIVCIDAMDPFGGGELLPKGKLREPLSSLERGDAFIITRANLAADVAETERTLRKFNGAAPIFHAAANISATARVGMHISNPKLRQCDRSTRVFAVCAIGNPDAFFETLEKDGRDVVGTRAFRDHHSFTDADIRSIEKEAAAAGAEAILVTRKDAVKMPDARFAIPAYSVRLETTVEPAEKFREMILGA